MDSIDRAIAYCTTFDPQLPGKLEGATRDRLARLEEYLGRPISDTHRRFLERMGNDSAWLRMPDMDLRIETVIDAHRRTEGPLPLGYELIGVNDDEPYQDAYLVDRGGREPRLATMASRVGFSNANIERGEETIVAGSLPEYLCLLALRTFRLPALPLSTLFHTGEDSTNRLATFDVAAEALDFTPMWFSNEVTRVLVRGETLAIAQHLEGRSTIITLASADKPLFESFAKRLREEGGFVEQRE